MSNVTSDNGVTSSQSPTGIEVIQVSDFYQRAGILHPITVGTIAIVLLFIYLRLSSNRVVAPMTLFDWLLNVALGSTLAGIVNGTSLTRGLLSLSTLMAFQLFASQLSSHYGLTLERALNSPPLVIAFRGTALRDVMRRHRISQTDLNSALRGRQIWNIRQVEAVIIEPTGTFTIYERGRKPDGMEAEVLMDVPGYRKLVEHFDMEHNKDKCESGGGFAETEDSEGDSGRSRRSEEAGYGRASRGDVRGAMDEEAAVQSFREVKKGRGKQLEQKEGDRGEKKEGGQGGEGPTTGMEREANDIAQSEA